MTARELTREQYFDFLNRVRKQAGSEQAPRPSYSHAKDGRGIAHVSIRALIFQKLVSFSFTDRQKIRRVVRNSRETRIGAADGLKQSAAGPLRIRRATLI